MKTIAFVSCAVLLLAYTGCKSLTGMHARRLNTAAQDSAHDQAYGDKGYTLNETEKALFELWYYVLQVKSVENDLRLHKADPDRFNQDASTEVITILNELAADLQSLTIPDTVSELRQILGAMIQALKDAAKGVPMSDKQALHDIIDLFWKKYDLLVGALGPIIDEHLTVPDVEDDVNTMPAELELFTDAGDRQLFKRAVDALERKQYEAAAAILGPLLKTYRGHAAEGSILSRYVDAYIAHDSPFRSMNMISAEARMLTFLDDYVERLPHSLKLHRLYLQWRTLSQIRNGFSNWSPIPNAEYNKVWLRFVRTCIEQLEQYPDDRWTKLIILNLWELDIIHRFVYYVPSGNTNVIYYSVLNGLWAKTMKEDATGDDEAVIPPVVGHEVNMPGGVLIIYGEHTIDPSYMWDVAEDARNAVLAACRAFANRFEMQFERYGTTTLSRHIGLSEQVEVVLGEMFANRQYDGLIQLSIEICEKEEEPGEYDTILNAEFFSLLPCPDGERAVQVGDKYHSVDYVIDTTSPGGEREVIVDYLAINFFEALKALNYLDVAILPDPK